MIMVISILGMLIYKEPVDNLVSTIIGYLLIFIGLIGMAYHSASAKEKNKKWKISILIYNKNELILIQPTILS